ncbi:MAG: hypothetical protein P8Q97_06880 [Myxococcota bacterium]|jgi:hypothetical protein|nr:hypothetical protein [Myxococcota bacterium]
MSEKSVSRIATPRWVYSAVRGFLSTPVLFLALVMLGPSVAAAAEIVDVRMGAHKGYVRLVFQLDAPADYKLEKGLGGEAMFVSIQARSSALGMKSPAPPVDSVTVAPSRSGTLARVEFGQSEVQMKEMVLTAPPRIVLDFMEADPAAAPAAAALAPVAKPAPEAPQRAWAPEPKTETPAPEPAKPPVVDIWSLDSK